MDLCENLLLFVHALESEGQEEHDRAAAPHPEEEARPVPQTHHQRVAVVDPLIKPALFVFLDQLAVRMGSLLLWSTQDLGGTISTYF